MPVRRGIPERVSVVGISGAGKSTLSARLAVRLGAPHIELDAIRHQAGWRELPDAEFVREVDERTRAPRWVVDGNYAAVQDLVWSRADTVIWLDPPRVVATARTLRRSLRRILLRVELWNGNRERWKNFFSLDPQESIVAWSWTQHGPTRERYRDEMRKNTRLRFERVSNPRDADQLVSRLAGYRA